MTIKNGRFLRSATAIFFYLLVFTAIELLVTGFGVARGLPSVLRNNFLGEVNYFLVSGVSLFPQFLFCFLVLAVCCEIIRQIFNIKSEIKMVIYIVTLGVAFTLAESPQIYFSVISKTTMLVAAFCFNALAIAVPTFLILRNQLQPKTRSWRNFFCGSLVIFIFSISSNKAVNIFDHATRPNEYKFAKDSFMILSIDSLRPDFIEEYIKKHPSSEFANILAQSARFDKMITPIGRTHPALTSLLTGLDPIEHGIRDNLFGNFADTDNLYSGRGLIKFFTDKGYQKKLMIDDTKYSSFTAGAAIGDIVSPKHSVFDQVVPYFFKSSLFATFFSNEIGDFLIPQTKMNAAYSISYRPKKFLFEIEKLLQDIKKDQPLFLLAHTCAMHYPGHSRGKYIYLNQTNDQELLTQYPNFFRGSTSIKPSYFPEYKRLAQGQFELIVNDVIEPFLQKLKNSPSSKNLTLVIMSDHGENFWKQGAKYQSDATPTHGLPAILTEDSYNSVFYVYSNKVKQENIKNIQSLTDIAQIVPKVMSSTQPVRLSQEIEKADFKYFESSVWKQGVFASQLSFSDRSTEQVYTVSPQGGILIEPSLLDELVLQKTKTVFSNEKHWSIFPTVYGYEVLSCVYPRCQGVPAAKAAATPQALEYLQQKNRPDVQRGLWPAGTLLLTAAGKSYWADTEQRQLIPKAKWLYTTNQLNSMGDIKKYIIEALKSLDMKDADLFIKANVVMTLTDFCQLGYSKHPCLTFANWVRQAVKSGELKQMIEQHTFLKNYIYYNLKKFDGENTQKTLEQLLGDPSELDRIYSTHWSKSFRLAIQSGLQKEARQLLSKLDANRPTTFYYKFLLALNPEICQTRENCQAELAKIEVQNNGYLELNLYEVNIDWLRFLYNYSRLTQIDFYSSAVEDFIAKGQLPLAGVLNILLQQPVLKESFFCFEKYEVIKILNNDKVWAKRMNWSETLYKKVQAQARCRQGNHSI